MLKLSVGMLGRGESGSFLFYGPLEDLTGRGPQKWSSSFIWLCGRGLLLAGGGACWTVYPVILDVEATPIPYGPTEVHGEPSVLPLTHLRNHAGSEVGTPSVFDVFIYSAI